MSNEVITYPNGDALAKAGAEFILAAAREAIQARGRFRIALSGGSTPEKCYALLAHEDPAKAEFSRWDVFFGDERFVPLDDPRSNFALAKRTLLSTGLIPENQVYPVPVDQPTPQAAAEAYCGILARVFQIPLNGPPPRFDLNLLGMGDDGHTASLFPGAKALDESEQWVTWSPPGVLPPPVDRVTFTFPTINASRQILFLVKGPKKADALKDVLTGHPTIAARPASGVRPTAGTLTWYVDVTA
jgi:6-phosphogluconolactonase